MPISFTYQSEIIQVDVSNYTVVDDGEAFAYLCARGVGLALMPHFTAKELAVKGELSILTKVDDFAGAGVYIVYPKREFMPKRTRVFIDFIKAQISELGESSVNTWLD